MIQKSKSYINFEKITVFQRQNNVSSSTLNQRWNLTFKQRWFWVDSEKPILFLYHDAWKIKIFIQRWNDDRISTWKQRHFINVNPKTAGGGVNLTSWQWFWVDAKTNFVLKLYQQTQHTESKSTGQYWQISTSFRRAVLL